MTARHATTYPFIGTRLPAAMFASVALVALVALPFSARAADDDIGTVRQIYDGKLLPDIQARTFRNIDKLFPTRTITAGGTVRELPLDLDPTIAI